MIRTVKMKSGLTRRGVVQVDTCCKTCSEGKKTKGTPTVRRKDARAMRFALTPASKIQTRNTIDAGMSKRFVSRAIIDSARRGSESQSISLRVRHKARRKWTGCLPSREKVCLNLLRHRTMRVKGGERNKNCPSISKKS